MITPTCEWIEERLPLLGYGELEADERNAVLAHLDACVACRGANAALEASAAALSAMPLRHPAARRVEGLKAAVLAAVGAAGCPREVDLIDPDAAGPDLDAHVEGCAPCREARAAFGQVRGALDLVPLARPSVWCVLRKPLAGLAGTIGRPSSDSGSAPRGPLASCSGAPPSASAASAARERVLARAGVAPVQAGRLVRFPARRLLAAAAALLGCAGAFALGRATAPADPQQVAALKQSADLLVRSSHPQHRGWVAPAITAYTQVVDVADDAAARQARREVEALRALERLQLRADSPGPDDLEALMLEFPDATSTFECALEGYRAGRGEVRSPLSNGAAPTGPREQQVSPWRAGRPGTIPYDDSALAEALKWISKPALRQAILLQRAIRLEDLGDLAQARTCYEQVLTNSTDTPAARIARERLAGL